MGLKQRIVEKTIGRLYDATLGKQVLIMPLEQQVALARSLPIPMHLKRAGILEDLPRDIRRMANEGKSDMEIKAYFWGCEAFRKLWESFQLQEATLDVMIHDTLYFARFR